MFKACFSSIRKGSVVAGIVCALGIAVNNAHAIGDLDNAQFSATNAEILSFLGGAAKAKLVFIDQDGGLYYVDFSEASQTIHKFANVNKKAVAPNISKNGDWVVYAAPGSDNMLTGDLTNDENVKSSAWLCQMDKTASPTEIIPDGAHVPRFAKDTDQLDLIYADIGIWDAWKQGKGKVVRQNVKSDGTKDGSPTTVFDRFALYGGLSYPSDDSKQYLGTAQGNTGGAWMVEVGQPDDTVQLHRLTVKVKPDTDVTEIITPQCCNPSITASTLHPETMMYMDFGSASKYHEVIKENKAPWYIHEIVFVGNFAGDVVMHFPQPTDIKKISTKEAGELKNTGETGGAIIAGNGNTYEFPEWSNHPHYAVVTVQTDRIWWEGGNWKGEVSTDVSRRRGEFIYLLDLKDRKQMRIMHSADTAQGRTMSYKWPWLWVEIPNGFQEDSQFLSIGSNKPFNGNWRKGSSSSAPKAVFDGRIVRSETGISRITVHNMLGREMDSFVAANGLEKSVNISEKFSVQPGVYFMRVQTAQGQVDVFRWVHTNK